MEIDRRLKEVLFTKEELEKRIKELSEWVNETYKDSNQLVLISILKGSIPFLAQLIKDIKVDHQIDFMTISTYKGAQESSGNIKIVMDLACDITDKDVLIIEDIVDSGISLEKVKQHLLARKPRDFKILTLLNKKETRKANIQVDKYGFAVPNKFLVGFGLDVKEKLRNLPYIGVFDSDFFDKM